MVVCQKCKHLRFKAGVHVCDSDDTVKKHKHTTWSISGPQKQAYKVYQECCIVNKKHNCKYWEAGN